MPSIRLVATDMDGTLTRAGKFDSQLLQRLEALQSIGVPVLVVTGRSAGWVSALVEYLPIAGAIAENGGYFFTAAVPAGQPLIDIPGDYRQQLEAVFQKLQQNFPQITPSADNPFRITDWTFDREDLSDDQLVKMATTCQAIGWDFTYSSIQCHIKSPIQSKQLGLLKTLDSHWVSPLNPNQVLTLGDSPNDSELLDHTVFPCSIGVANIQPYLPTMLSQPQWVSRQAELAGFLEVTDVLLNSRISTK